MDKPHTTPKDFFLYVGAIIALYVSAGSLLAVLFAVINASFPDAFSPYYDYYGGGMRFAIASLVIVFPIYIGLSSFVRRDVVREPAKRELGIRKWLLYLTLFVTGLVVVGDLIAVLNVFLGGELTARFIAKVLATLIVSGAIFAYYLYDIRRSSVEDKTVSRAIIASAIMLVFGSLVWGFIVMGSPATARQVRFDATRQSDLQNIQWQVINIWQQKGTLPSQLSELNDSLSYFVLPVDPETGAQYVYEKTAVRSFKLCATFARSSKGGPDYSSSMPVMGKNLSESRWDHEAGNACFDRTIDQDLYPVHKKGL